MLNMTFGQLEFDEVPVMNDLYRITATLNETGNRFSYDLPYYQAQDMYKQLTVHKSHEYSDITLERI